MIYFIKSFKDFKEYTTLLGEGGGGELYMIWGFKETEPL